MGALLHTVFILEAMYDLFDLSVIQQIHAGLAWFGSLEKETGFAAVLHLNKKKIFLTSFRCSSVIKSWWLRSELFFYEH